MNYQYSGPSTCVSKPGMTTLSLSPELSRSEKVSFRGKLKNPLVFRDAMLMLREIVVSDSKVEKKERKEFFEWLETEIDRRILEHDQYAPEVRQKLQSEIDGAKLQIENISIKRNELIRLQQKISKDMIKYDAWGDYDRLEREFWKFLYNRDKDMWFVLDPVITVHPDMVSFEAFSQDESIYGCLSIEMDEFELLQEPSLGTTNIDFSAKLAKEMERFRTYSDVELAVAPEGFAVETEVAPTHIEKKIDLPETWIKGFNQVSAAASLSGVTLDLSPVDMYDICAFLRRNKAHKSPRYMKWVMEKGKPVKIVFEPFGKELVLSTIYNGDKNREEKIWGRRRWLVAEKLIPVAKSFQIKLLGFGMPQFIVADLGKIKMTIGFSAWSSNDWVKGTAFNIMSGYIGEGTYNNVYSLMKKERYLSIDDIQSNLTNESKANNTSGIGSLLRRGEGYYDLVNSKVRFRQLTNEPIPKHLYETTPTEYKVKQLLDQGMENFVMKYTEDGEFIFSMTYKDNGEEKTEITLDSDGQITKLKCSCREFNRGPRNISAPCAHILALYVVSSKFIKLKPECGKEYRTNDIMELLL